MSLMRNLPWDRAKLQEINEGQSAKTTQEPLYFGFRFVYDMTDVSLQKYTLTLFAYINIGGFSFMRE